jgi:molybdopterin-guanine dinucleotide biosynthesis protein MobB
MRTGEGAGRPAKIIALTGASGSGKTTAIETLIRHYAAAGMSVGAIKHTHHEVSGQDRGDTRRFRLAGADPVILAGHGRAALFRQGAETEIFEYSSPDELTARFQNEILLIEGFKSETRWAKIELQAGRWLSLDDLVARV